MSKLSLKSDVDIQTDISNNQESSRKQSNEYTSIDPILLLEIYRKIYLGCYNDKDSIVEAKAVLAELNRIRAIPWEEYIKFLGKYYE